MRLDRGVAGGGAGGLLEGGEGAVDDRAHHRHRAAKGAELRPEGVDMGEAMGGGHGRGSSLGLRAQGEGSREEVNAFP